MELVTGQQIWDLVHRATQRAGFTADVSEVLADSTTEAELYGKSTVGLNHLFYYFQAATHELVNVAPEVTQQTVTDSMLKTHADHGPLQYAYRHSETALVDATRKHGIAVLMMSHAFAGGELGYFARRLARNGLVSVAFANGPAVMSVGGSFERLLGTNPLSYGIPLDDHRAMIIDQASSSTARVNFQKYAQRRVPIPEGWALDRHGQPTTDPQAALDGTLLPFGGYKGGNIGLLVELMAMLGGGDSSVEAAPYYAGERKQGIGASIIALDLTNLPGYSERIDGLLHEFTHERGSKIRITDLDVSERRVDIPQTVWSQLTNYANNGTVEQA